MKGIDRIVSDIVSRCQQLNVHVTEVLAAFVARTIVEKDSDTFLFDQEMSEDTVDELEQRVVDFLIQEDAPSLETIKMQINFDVSYITFEEEIDVYEKGKAKHLNSLRRSIASLQPTSNEDFDTLTSLYRQIFTLIMGDAEADNKKDRSIEREVAAALESVFPRIGLKAFIALPTQDKQDQLVELTQIIKGIRLLNRHTGKGGAGIELTIDDVYQSIKALSDELLDQVNVMSEICNQYTEVLIYVYHHQPEEVTSEKIQRWQEELENRRQMLSYLQSLQEDVIVSSNKVESITSSYDQHMKELQYLIGSRTSVPKEQVYPLFERLADAWNGIEHEHKILLARKKSHKLLQSYMDSFTKSLDASSEWIRKARKKGPPEPNQLFDHVQDIPWSDAQEEKSLKELHARFTQESAQQNPSHQKNSGSNENDDDKDSDRDTRHEKDNDDPNDKHAIDDDDDDAKMVQEHRSNQNRSNSELEKPVRLSIESTPEFMQLPLEYQGYCPWTILERGGLLLPGNPSHGVVRYANAYTVFVNERALQAFVNNPGKYISGIKNLAMRKPQLIQLLRLQDSFPEVALASLVNKPEWTAATSLRGDFGRNHHPLLSKAPPKMVDASTSTPTHFVEKHIDASYEWNEWALRRRALKLANLRKCVTISTQTTLSNFRKEMDTQVYLPNDHGTQTGITRGTNPKKTLSYLAGLRGASKTGSSKYAQADEEEKARPAVVTFTYDL